MKKVSFFFMIKSHCERGYINVRDQFGRWIVFGVLVCFLAAILISHLKRQEKSEVTEPEVLSKTEVERMIVAEIPVQEIPVEEIPQEKITVDIETTPEVDLKGLYPSDPQVLKKMLEGFLKKAEKKKGGGLLVGLVTPHAALEYTGKIAATAFKQLEGGAYDTVVLLLPNHKAVNLQQIVICPKGEWGTPLGTVEVDKELAQQLKQESSEFQFAVAPFEQEHALHVQLPFLQMMLKNFKILPVMVGGRSSERAMRLADALNRATQGKKVLFLATTHLSRGEVYEKAKRIDFLVTSALEQCDDTGLRRYESEHLVQMCGYGPALTLLYLLQQEGVQKGVLLSASNSADVTGKKEETIVGYASMAFYKEEKKK